MSSSEEGEDDNSCNIVLDNGSQTCRAGLAGCDAPDVMVTTALSRDHVGGEWRVGEELGEHVNQPIKRGVVEDWEAMEKVGVI